jgi:dihydropteroate synthase
LTHPQKNPKTKSKNKNLSVMLTLRHLHEIYQKYRDDYSLPVAEFEIEGTPFCWNTRPHLMGVVNLSPDSWYRESVCLSAEHAIERCFTLASQGADIVDIGAESTILHASRADASLQNSRALPVILEASAAGIIISIETYLTQVAREAFEAGARVLNLTGNFQDEDLFRIVADHDGAVILCYVQGSHVRDVSDFSFSEDIVGDMRNYFSEKIETCARNGVSKILLDPGLGFYYKNFQDSTRRVRHQMEVFLQTFRLKRLGFPLCHALPHAFEYFREEVTTAEPFFAQLALLGGTHLFRTHEVSKVAAVARTYCCF